MLFFDSYRTNTDFNVKTIREKNRINVFFRCAGTHFLETFQFNSMENGKRRKYCAQGQFSDFKLLKRIDPITKTILQMAYVRFDVLLSFAYQLIRLNAASPITMRMPPRSSVIIEHRNLLHPFQCISYTLIRNENFFQGNATVSFYPFFFSLLLSFSFI